MEHHLTRVDVKLKGFVVEDIRVVSIPFIVLQKGDTCLVVPKTSRVGSRFRRLVGAAPENISIPHPLRDALLDNVRCKADMSGKRIQVVSALTQICHHRLRYDKMHLLWCFDIRAFHSQLADIVHV